MDELLGQFMTPQIKFILGVFAVFTVLIYIASIIWVYRDAKLRGARAELWAVLAIIPLAGVVLYWILRPAMYEQDFREQELEIARRERELYTEGYCRSCSYPVESDYLICPNCNVKLKKECISCGKPLKLKWDVCPYCRTKQEEAPVRMTKKSVSSAKAGSSSKQTSSRNGATARASSRRRKSE